MIDFHAAALTSCTCDAQRPRGVSGGMMMMMEQQPPPRHSDPRAREVKVGGTVAPRAPPHHSQARCHQVVRL